MDRPTPHTETLLSHLAFLTLTIPWPLLPPFGRSQSRKLVCWALVHCAPGTLYRPSGSSHVAV